MIRDVCRSYRGGIREKYNAENDIQEKNGNHKAKISFPTHGFNIIFTLRVQFFHHIPSFLPPEIGVTHAFHLFRNITNHKFHGREGMAQDPVIQYLFPDRGFFGGIQYYDFQIPGYGGSKSMMSKLNPIDPVPWNEDLLTSDAK